MSEERRSALYERCVRARLPQTVQELVWLHADLRMADVPEAASLYWVEVAGVLVIEAKWEVDTSDVRPV